MIIIIGSEAESARIMVGDIVTEVNGHDCLKGVGISRIMGFKSLIQQSSIDAGEEHVDVCATIMTLCSLL